MKIIVLDLTGCKTWDDLHERIRVAFDFPEWYGCNWDAFWDLLWSECDADKVIIKGENTMPAEFDEDLCKMHEALDDNIESRKDSNSGPFTYEVIS